MNKLLKYFVARTYKPLLVRYLSKTRTYVYKDIVLSIPREVFHPGFFFSTKLLLRYISQLPLKQKSFLELGAGSGLISIFAAKKEAIVTATDINPVAIEFLEINRQFNHVDVEIIHADLFDQVPVKEFDIIAINPPYYKKKPASYAEYAWCCGEHGEYFDRLFKRLRKYMHDRSSVLMILCDGCDIDMIHSMADLEQFDMNCVFEKKNLLENNFIFKITQRE
ncbi:MAG: methyltransferase [Bacteroidetes bacterium]|nr:methyltransferase [Bacteroidota bacterium]